MLSFPQSPPEVAGFVWPVAFEADPFATLDGKRLFYVSDRPRPGESTWRVVQEICVVERLPDGAWGAPRFLGTPVHSGPEGGGEWHPVETAEGVLYFSSRRPGEPSYDLFRTRRNGGAGYFEPERLPASDPAAYDTDPWIAPDESYLIFASDRGGPRGSFDLYRAVHGPGGWGPPVRLPQGVNTDAASW